MPHKRNRRKLRQGADSGASSTGGAEGVSNSEEITAKVENESKNGDTMEESAPQKSKVVSESTEKNAVESEEPTVIVDESSDNDLDDELWHSGNFDEARNWQISLGEDPYFVDDDNFSDYDDSDDYSGWGDDLDDMMLANLGAEPYQFEPLALGNEREVANVTGTSEVKIEKVDNIKSNLRAEGYTDKDIDVAITRYKQRTTATFAENAILEDLKMVAGEPEKETNAENEETSKKQLCKHGACVVCLDTAKETVLIPCGHFCSCRSCARQITSCPVCRAKVERVIRFFEV